MSEPETLVLDPEAQANKVMTSFDKEIRTVIQATVPSLPTETQDKLIEHLLSCGVENKADLVYVNVTAGPSLLTKLFAKHAALKSLRSKQPKFFIFELFSEHFRLQVPQHLSLCFINHLDRDI
ncbi:hypothetical protein DPEC_G00072390 [Dallia pectoralis]|uniref:Uncharacterized protein n=1 Tax=Dallia pectoralis TaxID=75939 RepID=A0ACC2H2N7_DALPE|nr:hypothetical protein DPEC_G00072390 [Dallia pectoralis]